MACKGAHHTTPHHFLFFPRLFFSFAHCNGLLVSEAHNSNLSPPKQKERTTVIGVWNRALARAVGTPGVEATGPELMLDSGFPPGTVACVGCVCVCVGWGWCECCSMARSETTRAVSSVLSPVNVGARNLT